MRSERKRNPLTGLKQLKPKDKPKVMKKKEKPIQFQINKEYDKFQ